ncbi:class I adenylate-forming enzyme family protein [Agromyces sp. Marseille-Q5079]|uniref:class I adenylate-forming enzyme family protein n=1 Tax=Agromyces sp. Marseille-Q5079 TaxID=3439059 RepID=UPI003D9C9A38
MSDWLNGSPHATALAFEGGAVRYVELAQGVAGAGLPAGDGPVACPAGLDAVTLVIRVLAALDRGRPVLVGGTQREADALAASLPAGTELALLTSGSSGGAPRVVARTSRSWLASAGPLAEVAGLGRDDRIAVTGPLHASMHLYAVLHALWLGATATDAIDGASVAHATPTRLARMLDSGHCPPSVVVAGAVLAPSLRAVAEHRGIRLTEYYGAAELSFVLAGCGGDLRPFPGVEVQLRPSAATDDATELWARSPYLALGVIGGGMLRRDDDAFATVGDLAEHVATGAWRVLGRGDAAITTAGATVLAEHVESRLVEVPGVLAAAVLGEPHDLLGERVVAVVELEPGASLDEVARAARGRLTAPELPRRWFAAPVPHTASGKVARRELRDALASGRLDESAAPTRSGRA